MIRLDTTTRKLQLVLGGAVAATQPDIVVCYSDATATGYTGGTQVSVGNSTTAVDICAAPGASTVRDVDIVNVRNNDSASIIATIRFNDNGTTYKLITVSLLTGEQLNYTHGSGWCALDVSGNRKAVVAAGLTVLANSLSADVALNNNSNFFTGPSVAQGTEGGWFASGTVTFLDPSATTLILTKLWDGATVLDSSYVAMNTVNKPISISLSGYLPSPAGNIKISANAGSTTALIKYNYSGEGKDSTLTLIKVA